MLSEKMVSILIAAYNEESFLEAAVNSVVQQSYPNIELVIVENGSSDSTAEVIKRIATSHPTTLKYRTGLPKGKNAAFNLAYEMCSGDLITFMSADDILKPRAVEERVSVLEDPNDFATCLYLTFSDDSKYNNIQYPKDSALPNFTAGSMLFPRSLADKIFPIPTDLPNEDSWTSLHLRAFGTNKHVPKTLYRYRIHGENSFGYGEPFEEKKQKYFQRMEGFERFYHKYHITDNKFVNCYLHYFVKGLSLAKSGKFLQLFLQRNLPMGDKLRMMMYSNKILYSIRHRFFRLFSGVINT